MQQVFKLVLILMVTTTCGQDNEDTTISPSQDEAEPQANPPTSQNVLGFSDKDRQKLGNLVLIDRLCTEVQGPVTPNCRHNRREMDAFILGERALADSQRATPDPKPGRSTLDFSSPASGLVGNASNSPEGGGVEDEVEGRAVNTSVSPTSLLSLLGQRSVFFEQSPSNWTRLFSVFSAILQKAPQLRVSNLDFPGLKKYLFNHQLGENTLQTLLGLVISKSMKSLHAKLNQTSVRMEKPLATIGKVEMYSVLAFGFLLVIAVVMCLCWVSQNVATWRGKRNARRELRRQERASRLLHGLQQARYRQQTGEAEVRLMSV